LSYSQTDIGKKRKFNQDYVFAQASPVGKLPNLFLVADGMGGHNAGDYASKCSVETIIRCCEMTDQEDPGSILQQAFWIANQTIRQKAMEQIDLYGMGTTLVAATLDQDEKILTVANVGDSRLYVCANRLTQITTDHSLVEEMIQRGGIDKNSARNHPDKNIITRAIGASNELDIDFFSVLLSSDDLVLLCSDGLTNMLEDEEIYQILRGKKQKTKELRLLANDLILAANKNGGRDNIAVVLMQDCGTNQTMETA
jgi:protein phosphatase